ncbi:Uncharacterised protein [Mycobacteroides abscessus subsp. massiliense]|uniref:Uncharacterized protein n=1 Tax=Mycobacteroides abscessus subsp. massiliense TaxID=1962118 RepID=A0A1U0TFA2_9MYCO|nr:hypothetical protein [Mycobacteroides abscessus]SKL83932.1 Uncharacterised protein [Mycobacteroides abscessus subsp. massiliense]SKS91640.1 Uncharacterised protein [Mycobacteroides abscessus subsp. massiliense]SKT20276.1 Uncharacterised protein [Mycobacteroides abscessus subsp. massiliense]SKW82903.1 Uncharacterised protein [Mycobacteroides abscessus subsp. massiliense]
MDIPRGETPTRTVRKRGRDIQVGDDLVFEGKVHRITRITPYDQTRAGLPAGTGWRTADAEFGWGITLNPDADYYEVLERPR